MRLFYLLCSLAVLSTSQVSANDKGVEFNNQPANQFSNCPGPVRTPNWIYPEANLRPWVDNVKKCLIDRLQSKSALHDGEYTACSFRISSDGQVYDVKEIERPKGSSACEAISLLTASQPLQVPPMTIQHRLLMLRLLTYPTLEILIDGGEAERKK